MTKATLKKKAALEKTKPRSNEEHPSHTNLLPRLNRVAGQISGIEKMIQEKRYCIDILIQFRAAMSALRVLETEIFERHLKHCVHETLLSGDKQNIASKIEEISKLLNKRTVL